MDYLYQIINGHRAPYVVAKNLPVISIIDSDIYQQEQVRYMQVRSTIAAIREYRAKSQELWQLPQNADVEDNRYEVYLTYQANLLRKLDNKNMNLHTLYYLIMVMETAINSDIENSMFTILFTVNNGAAVQLIKQSATPLPIIEEDPNGIINLYGIKYAKKAQKITK